MSRCWSCTASSTPTSGHEYRRADSRRRLIERIRAFLETSVICGTEQHTFAGEPKQYAGTPAETDTPF
jgi:hypothetical protein